MSINSESTAPLGRREHNEDAAAKRVVIRAQDPSSGSFVNIAAHDNGDGTYGLSTSSGDGYEIPKITDKFGIQAISNDGTYKYFWFEDDTSDWYIMRKNLTTFVFDYTKGTGGYSSVYQNSTSGPSGSPTWADRGATF